MPFRLYYNLSVKSLIFGQVASVSNFDAIVYMMVASLLTITITVLFRFKYYAMAVITLLGFLAIILLSIYPLNVLIAQSFGLNTVNENVWILYPILMFIILYTWSQIIENWPS